MHIFRRSKPSDYNASLESASLKVLDALLAAPPAEPTQSDRDWARGYKFVTLPSYDPDNPQGNNVPMELPRRPGTNYWSAVADVPLTLAEANTRKDIPRVLSAALRDFDIRNYEADLGGPSQMKHNKKVPVPVGASVVYTYIQPFATPHDPDAFIGILKRNLPEIRDALHEACQAPAHAAGTGAGAGRY